jgi:ABC-type sugar transport system permease subunit
VKLYIRNRSTVGFLLILPTLIVMSIFTVYPLIDGIRLSFTNRNLLREAVSFVGLANYVELTQDPVFWLSLWHSLVLTASAVLLQFVLGLVLASALKQNLPLVRMMRNIIMASWVIPVVATVVMFQFMSQPDYGFINIVFRLLGFENLNSYWFGNLNAAFPMIVIMHLWRNIPFYGVAFMAAMQAIPQDYYDAAKIDGAGTWKAFTNVTIPGIRSMIMVMVTIHVLWTLNNFDFVYIATGGGPVNATDILPVYVYRLTWSNYTIGYGSAVGTVMLVILAVYFITYMMLYERKQR